MTAILVRFLPNGQVRIYIHVWYGVLEPMQHKACSVLAPYVVGWSDMADYSKCVCEHTLVSLLDLIVSVCLYIEYMCVCICMYVCMYIFICLRICIY